MITVYIGAVFQLAGSLQQDGAPADFSGWAFVANLYDQSGDTLIAPLIVTWLDPTTGLFTLSAADTSGWSAGKARIDIKLTTQAGDTVLGPPAYLRIAQSPLS